MSKTQQEISNCFIALGGNVGLVEKTFEQATELMASYAEITVQKLSSYYVTRAVGKKAGPDFLNAVLHLQTLFSPQELLQTLQKIETELGRFRTQRWEPRTLDLDILFYGNQTIHSTELQIPHSACSYRRFVLDPLVEIAPETIHPQREKTVADLRNRLLPRPLLIALSGAERSYRLRLKDRIEAEFDELEVVEYQAHASELDPALIFYLGPTSLLHPQPVEFEILPQVSRINLSTFVESHEKMISEILQSALQEPLLVY